MHLGFVHSRNITLIHTNPKKQTPLNLHTLDELVTTLSTEEQSKYNSIIRSVNLSSSDMLQYSSWCDKSYTRNCIAENEKFELILLCWKAGQITPIHDHGGEECWVKIIEGEFQETIYTADESGKLTVLKSMISKSGDITYMIDFMGYHKLENLSDKKSLSLHLYAKPIRSCNVFDEGSRKFVNKDLVYSTNAQLAAI